MKAVPHLITATLAAGAFAVVPVVVPASALGGCATMPSAMTPEERFDEDVLEYGNETYVAPTAGDVYLAMVLGLWSLGYTLDAVDVKAGIVTTKRRAEKADDLSAQLAGKLIERSVEVHVRELKGATQLAVLPRAFADGEELTKSAELRPNQIREWKRIFEAILAADPGAKRCLQPNGKLVATTGLGEPADAIFCSTGRVRISLQR